jgi:hypothetical protein
MKFAVFLLAIAPFAPFAFPYTPEGNITIQAQQSCLAATQSAAQKMAAYGVDPHHPIALKTAQKMCIMP